MSPAAEPGPQDSSTAFGQVLSRVLSLGVPENSSSLSHNDYGDLLHLRVFVALTSLYLTMFVFELDLSTKMNQMFSYMELLT